MRFELTVALKYLIPKWRQLSVSIISLISVIVISLVVWLVVLFLSVTEGIERKWIEELVALNAPVRVFPTDAYYHSYYYQIDSVCLDSNFTTKTIGEKLTSLTSDPYNSSIDMELSLDFPPADLNEDGNIKDIVKEGFEAIHSLPYKGIRPQEYEVNFSNLHLQVIRDGTSTFLTQLSYVASHDGNNQRINQMIIPPSTNDYNNLLNAIAQTSTISEFEIDKSFIQEKTENLSEKLKIFFNNLEIKKLQTTSDGFLLPPTLFPKQGQLKGIGIICYDQVIKIIIPQSIEQLTFLEKRLDSLGYKTTPVNLCFDERQTHISSQVSAHPNVQILLDDKISFHAHLLNESLANVTSLNSLIFEIEGNIQNIPISGRTVFEHLGIAEATQKKITGSSDSFWACLSPEGTCSIPTHDSFLGKGLLVAKHFQKNGVCLGDRGYLAYYTLAGNSMQEQRLPIYVAGFYDPGMMPIGNKLIFVDPQITATLRSNTALSDPLLGNGINVWLDNLTDALACKEDLIKSLERKGIGKYWTVQSYHDYEFTRPILEQLESDKHLFSLIAMIILIVACSNIISMLILLVKDKKKEIGILQSIGASPIRIAIVFGLCGFVTGLISCILGVTAAILTLKNLQSLVSFLSFLQGRDAFQTAFYGSSLPNELSYSVLTLVSCATLLISLLAGIIPAIKASRIRPTEILRSE